MHVSGHASAGELLYCYNIIKPKNVMPVHGEMRHLVANAELAVKTGVPRERVLVAEDGVVVDLIGGKATIAGKIECGLVYVDGSTVGEITEADLKDRRILGEEGFISIIVVVDSASGKVLAGPEIHARGFAEDEAVFDKVRPRILDAAGRGQQRHQQRHAPALADRAARGRPLGERVLPAPADDHPLVIELIRLTERRGGELPPRRSVMSSQIGRLGEGTAVGGDPGRGEVHGVGAEPRVGRAEGVLVSL